MASGELKKAAVGAKTRAYLIPMRPITHRAFPRTLHFTMSRNEVLHAYRHLYRHGLRAVQFSKPARYTLRDRLRLAFRKGTPADLNIHKISNTIEFLHYATIENGLEHKILKNLLFVWRNQDRGGYKRLKTQKLWVQEDESAPLAAAYL